MYSEETSEWSGGMRARVRAWLGTRGAMIVAIGVSVGIASLSIWIGFLTDDHVFRAALHSRSEHAPAAWDLFRFVSGSEEGNALRMCAGHLVWWAAPELKIHFLRPVTSLVFALDDRVFGEAAVGYHAVSLAWWAVLLGGAAALFRRLLSASAATIAVAVFGLAAAHVEGYAWVSARHVIIGGAFGAWALWAVVGKRRWLGGALLVLGLASSEAALGVVPLWMAIEIGRAGEARRARWLACVPAGLVGIGYLIAYRALDGGTRASGGYHDPMADPIGFAGLVVRRVPLLLGDAAWGVPAELAHVVDEWKLAVIGGCGVGLIAWMWRRRREREGGAAMGWWMLGGVLACVPGAAGFPSGRVLVIPDLAFAVLLGALIDRGLAPGIARAGIARAGARVLIVLLAIAHLVIAPLGAVRTIGKLARRARATERIATELVGAAPASGRVWLIAASDPMVFLYPRGIAADVAPGALRCFGVVSAARSRHRLTRTGPGAFELEAVERPLMGGVFEQLFRAPDHRFVGGERVEQCGAMIEVREVRDGRPTRIGVSVRGALDGAAWLVWREGHLVRFGFPDIGGSVEIDAWPGPSGVL